MTTLNILITHLSAADLAPQLELLRAIAPASRFVAVYAGDEAEFARIDGEDIAWLHDPSLAGPPRSFQSYTVLLELAWKRWFEREAGLDALYLFEFDHLILAPRFEQSLQELADATGAGFMGKNAVPRNATNWHHYTRFRRDGAVLEQLVRVTVRAAPTTMYGTLGNGMWLSRSAVQSYIDAGPHPECYGELYVPTLLHHLGHEVVDVDAHSSLYDAVRWMPEFTAAEVDALARGGAVFVHPVKDADVRMAALRAAAAQSWS